MQNPVFKVISISVPSWPFSPGPAEALKGPLLLPVGTRCSDSSQQGASPEERHV